MCSWTAVQSVAASGSSGVEAWYADVSSLEHKSTIGCRRAYVLTQFAAFMGSLITREDSSLRVARSRASTRSHDDFAPGAANARQAGRERPAMEPPIRRLEITGGDASESVKHNRRAFVS